jgi:ADP-L-glycero-D-manno-heptose 6-epimerase
VPYIKKNEFINLFKSNSKTIKDGEQKRDFVFCDDIVNLVKFLSQKKPESGIYNVGTGVARSFNELAAIIFDCLRKRKDIRYIDMPENLSEKYQNFTQANISKIIKVGFNDFTSLEEGIEKVISRKI